LACDVAQLDLEVYALAALYMLGEHARKKLGNRVAASPNTYEQTEARCRTDSDDALNVLATSPAARQYRRRTWRPTQFPKPFGRGWAGKWRD
jgi:hypothetical protein